MRRYIVRSGAMVVTNAKFRSYVGRFGVVCTKVEVGESAPKLFKKRERAESALLEATKQTNLKFKIYED